jgi:CRP-like cAMP-binding protein
MHSPGMICVAPYMQGSKRVVATLGTGAFFGEVALVTHAPRAADVVAASSKVKLLSLGRDAFERLMGAHCASCMLCLIVRLIGTRSFQL